MKKPPQSTYMNVGAGPRWWLVLLIVVVVLLLVALTAWISSG